MPAIETKLGTVLVDSADWEQIKDLTVYVGSHGYATYSIWKEGRSNPYLLHHLLMQPQRGMHVDHINGNKLDNRRENLRIVTPQQNQINRKRLNRNNTSGIRGVAFRPNISKARPWHAQIHVGRKGIYLGVFPTREEAIEARRLAELEHYGELCP